MNRLYLFIFGVILLLLSGCISGPDVSRINKNDPDSEFYYPKFSSLKALLSSSEKRININWVDKSQFNDGFLIKKRLSKKDNFITIDTAYSSAFKEYLEDYSLEMEYEITSFYIRNNRVKFGQHSRIDSLYFGKIEYVGYYSQNDTLFVQWFRDTAFDDRTTIKYKQQNSSNWEVLSTIVQADLPDDFYRTYFKLPTGIKYDFRIEVDLQNYKDEFETFYRREFSYFHR